jgi:hypothetical protein
MNNLDASEILNARVEDVPRMSKSKSPLLAKDARNGAPGSSILNVRYSMFDSLQVFLGMGVGVGQGQGGAEFFSGCLAVALLFQQLA